MRTETIWKTRTGELSEFRPLLDFQKKEEEEIIDMKENKNKRLSNYFKKVFSKN
ncbi:MAG: hypothetical protein R3B39_01920 [Candidatus Paceibacterota bacterium]